MESYKKIHSAKPAAYLTQKGKQVIVTSPYNSDFVVQLKAATKTRRWNPEKKAWSVDISEKQQLIDVAGQFYQIIEESVPSEPPGKPTPSTAAKSGEDKVPFLKPGSHVEIWTDGACSSNPGPGGYGIIFKSKGNTLEKSGGFRLTTNNRMELMGVIVALENLPANCTVKLYCDSTYLVNSLTKGWAEGWRARSWVKKGGERVPNADLWKRLLAVYSSHDIDIRWIKGHNGSPENERCDEMAVAEAARHGLPEDNGYERGV